MNDFVNLTNKEQDSIKTNVSANSVIHKNNVPSCDSLQNKLVEAGKLVDDVILKKYLSKLTELEIAPLEKDLNQISNIRIFKITEMIYQKNEYSTYKFASVFNAVQNLNCGVFVLVDGKGHKTEFYMGVRSLDDTRTTKSLKDTLRNALCGQFPGVKTIDFKDKEIETLINEVPSSNIAVVSCVGQNKDEEFKDNQRFIQGLEKMAMAMQGHRYTAILLAKSTSADQLAQARLAYETIYTQLSPFANMQFSYGTNSALNVSDAFSKGSTIGFSHTTNTSSQIGSSYSKGTSLNESETKTDTAAVVAKSIGTALLGVASIATAPLTGGGSLIAAGAIMAGNIGLSAINPSSTTKGTSTSETWSSNSSETKGESDSTNESSSETFTNTKGLSSGKSDNLQLTMQNKTLINTLERIDLQLKRIEEFESLGMWESAAYFLSETQETTEMAAGTYKAIMKGEKSGVETSSINFWGRQRKDCLPLLHEYITNFIHPVFLYQSESITIPLTASSFVSGNELAIQMGLPRKSVCGFPVIEHAEFGNEVVKQHISDNGHQIVLGNVFSMGKETNTQVRLDRDSLTMHTFITGSTGSGKSNTIYEILNQLTNDRTISFLVVEPAKGEYKNVFGQFSNVVIYGTNPKKTGLLKINPFRFPSDIHVLEHLDRLVEIFNVCWPMYAAMPAILKEAMEKSYVSAGWNINTSENPNGEIFPNFADLLEQIEKVINESKYSVDSKGDYSGALITRIRSLTNGLNGLIFCDQDLNDSELFDRNVIVDLSRVGSTETKSLIMGLLVMKLNEYRMCSGNSNSPLTHVTVLEEAHNLLKRTSTEQSSESSNLLGKSVELLANSIAEMRTYGEGFIIADQSPGLLDLSVIRNTNTKIILRLPEQSDRQLVGFAAGLNKDQIEELSKLERGVAAVYQNDWIEPVLVKVSKCGVTEKPYTYIKHIDEINVPRLREQILSLLIQGRVRERLDFNVDNIERGLHVLGFSLRNRDFIEEQIAEYKETSSLEIWTDAKFRNLSRYITEIMGLRLCVENVVLNSVDASELTDRLTESIKPFLPNASGTVIFAISQCLMKDLSTGSEEIETRERIYKQWVDFIKKERGF